MSEGFPFSSEQLDAYRPIPFYFITTTDPQELSYEAAMESLSQLKADGFGGIVLFNKPPHGFDAQQYLGEAWFSMVKNFVRAAAALGLAVWLNDGFNFPPGDAGGRITREKYPELAQKRIVLTPDGVQVQEVDWGFPAFEEPKSAELFHEIVYEAYKAHVGEYFGTVIQGFFSDADNRRVGPQVFQEGSPMLDFFPWSNNFADTFAQQYGYDILPYLPAVLKKEPGQVTADYWEHAGRLYRGWFAANYRWCRENGLEYTFHTSDSPAWSQEYAPRSSLYTEGRALDTESCCDWPGTDQELLELNGGKHMRLEDFWMPKASWGGDAAHVRNPAYRDLYSDLRPVQAGSAAFLHGKKGAMCEMFAATNWGASFNDLREIAARQIMQGINFIVPHAYHHRLRGDTKFFAPPDFSPRSHLASGMRAFNDMLAQSCLYASMGRRKAPVAVLDVTDDIWARRGDSKAVFEVCLQLDRLPYGYIIADAHSIAANAEAFSVVINAGAAPEGERARVLAATGLPVVGPEALKELDRYVSCAVRYEGEGTPHFMRRELPDGRELILLCSLEQEEPIRGQLWMGDTAHPVYLQSGEMAFYTAEGRLGTELLPECDGEGIPLPGTAAVAWEAPNVIPLEFWRNAKDTAVPKIAEVRQLNFSFTTEEALPEAPVLLVPEHCLPLVESLALDGVPLTLSGTAQLWDEPYRSCPLPGAAVPGQHTLTLEKNAPLPDQYPLFLQGEFGVRLKTGSPWQTVCGRQYNLTRYIPEKAAVTLYAREKELNTAQSWTEQGHPFYSGAATYRFELELPQLSAAVLELPGLTGCCTAVLDGTDAGSRIFAPYVYPLGAVGGEHTLELRVENTLANMLECYRAPSGLTAGGRIAPQK